LRVKVSASGSVEDVQIEKSSGYPRLDQASVDAVKKSCFRPAMRSDGKLVDGFTTVIHNWVLREGSPR
jgi:protein TonB